MSSREASVAPSVLRISSHRHRVSVSAEDRLDIVYEGRADGFRSGDTLTLAAHGALRVRVPVGTAVRIGTESGRVEVKGPVGDVAVVSTSGRVEIEHADSVDVRSRSGRVEVGVADGDVRARSATGRVSIGRCASADVATETGRIDVDSASAPVIAHCISGRIGITMGAAADVEAETVTGRVQVRLPEGTRPFRPVDDAIPAVRPDGWDCTVVTRSVSGRVDVSS